MGKLNPLSMIGPAAGKQKKEFVSTYQDPFHKDVAGIVDPLVSKRDSGTLTYEEAFTAQQTLEDRISRFEFDADQYAVGGNDQATAVAGARQTLNPIIANWRNVLKADVDRLGPKLNLAAPPTLENILAGSGKTPTGQAKAAADAVKKKKGGYTSTILTGYKPTIGSKPRPKTVTGY